MGSSDIAQIDVLSIPRYFTEAHSRDRCAAVPHQRPINKYRRCSAIDRNTVSSRHGVRCLYVCDEPTRSLIPRGRNCSLRERGCDGCKREIANMGNEMELNRG